MNVLHERPHFSMEATMIEVDIHLSADGHPVVMQIENGDVRAGSVLQISSLVRFNTYAKNSQIRCSRDFASCHGPGYRTKKDIY